MKGSALELPGFAKDAPDGFRGDRLADAGAHHGAKNCGGEVPAPEMGCKDVETLLGGLSHES